MPKATFFNLTSSKKQKILEVLLQNFSKQPISQVKVADIVEGIQMSRGAFYKYFDDLEDAYTYTIRHYSNQVHQDILMYIGKKQEDFFQGIADYLTWCTTLNPSDSYWLVIQCLTKSTDLSSHKRVIPSSRSTMLKEWFHIIKTNGFLITNEHEALSFLYFVMELVIHSLTDYIANDWSEKQLLQDFSYKVKWLKFGLKNNETRNEV